MFGSIKTYMVEYFGKQYAALSETTVDATRIGARRAFQYRDFDNTKLPIFNGVQDPIISMRWLSDIEGCFFTCSFPTD